MTQRVWDIEEPLARCTQLRESRVANQALLDYAALGGGGGKRSLRALHQQYLQRVKESKEAAGMQPASTAQAEAAMRAIFNLPPTTQLATLFSWSAKHFWQERIEDYDNNMRQQRLLKAQADQAAMLERHAQLGRSLQRAGLQRLQQMLTTENGTNELTPEQVRLFVQAGVNIERAASGLPEELIAVMSMTDDQLQQRYLDLLARIGSASSSDESAGS